MLLLLRRNEGRVGGLGTVLVSANGKNFLRGKGAGDVLISSTGRNWLCWGKSFMENSVKSCCGGALITVSEYEVEPVIAASEY